MNPVLEQLRRYDDIDRDGILGDHRNALACFRLEATGANCDFVIGRGC